MREDRWCQRCGTKNEILDDVCQCGWHCGDDREATEEEVAAVSAKLDEACDNLRQALDSMDRDPRKAKIIAHNDQIAARLRDMTEEEREDATVAIAEQLKLTIEDARDWVQRLLEPED